MRSSATSRRTSGDRPAPGKSKKSEVKATKQAGAIPVVTMDGAPVGIQNAATLPLDAVIGHLSTLALKLGRVIARVSVDGEPVDHFLHQPDRTGFLRLEVETVTTGALGDQVIAGARRQIRILIAEVNEAAVLVLINDWPIARSIWLNLLPAFKTPMLGLGFLKDLWGVSIDEITSGPGSFREHWEMLDGILADGERMLRGDEDTIALSQLLELRLGPWLGRNLDFLDRLHEHRPL